MPQSKDSIVQSLEALERTQKEHSRLLATLESRILIIHDEFRRSAETISRLKLMADNARKIARSHGETLDAIWSKLDSSTK